jgi:hypothetical protein
MPKYFVTYSEDNGKRILNINDITDLHPIEFLLDLNKQYPNSLHVLLFWSEIPDEIAEANSSILEG